MSILKALSETKKDFDPKKDSIHQSSYLEPGTYPVRLKQAERVANRGGYEEVKVTLEVVSGEDKGRNEFINLGFNEDLPEFVLQKNGRILLKIAAMVDVELTKSDVQDEESVAEALSRGVGKQFKMILTTSPNRKNPQYPYRNYEFEPLEEEGEASIPEDELDEFPF